MGSAGRRNTSRHSWSNDQVICREFFAGRLISSAQCVSLSQHKNGEGRQLDASPNA